MHDFVRDMIRFRLDHTYALSPKTWGGGMPFAWKNPENQDADGTTWAGRAIMMHYYDDGNWSDENELALLVNQHDYPIEFTLPRGIQLVDVSSTSGNLVVSDDGGRQVVTYVVPPGEFSDQISYRIQIGWLYFLIQFWVYPTIVLILLVLFIRRRRRKKKKKKAALENREVSINKAQLGDSEFADLAGFASPALRHGETIEDMAYIDELSR